jgi:serine/threonine protein phosphatase PrpC
LIDGHCGKDAATFCKNNLCKHIGKSQHFLTNLNKALEEGFSSCDEAFRSYAHDEEKASPFAGCTGIVAIVRDNILTVANCGDSRAVLACGGKVIPMSEDHKPQRPDGTTL